MGSVLAELLLQQGCQVTFVTPAPLVAYWSQYTLEQEKIQRRLMKSDVKIFTQQILEEIHPEKVTLTDSVSGEAIEVNADIVVLITDRLPNDELYQALKHALKNSDIQSLCVIGDAEAPNTIAQAVFSGHLTAQEFGEIPVSDTPFKIERAQV
jgi:dimethylamine/trimethylamine dehydrogenase